MTAKVISLCRERLLRQQYPDPEDRVRAVAWRTYDSAKRGAWEALDEGNLDSATALLEQAREAVEALFENGAGASALGLTTVVNLTRDLDVLENAIAAQAPAAAKPPVPGKSRKPRKRTKAGAS